MDLSKVKLDWKEIKEKQQDKAQRNVKAALLLDKIARARIHSCNEGGSGS